MNDISPKVEAMSMAIDMVGVKNPHIYYPGCGDDLSFEGLGRVTYVDIARFSGNQAIIQANATEYKVEDEVDIVAMFDVGDRGKEEIMTNLTLSAGGLVLWRGYNASVPELTGPSMTFESLRGVFVADEEGTNFESTDLEQFFEFTPFGQMDTIVLEALIEYFQESGQELPSEPAEAWKEAKTDDFCYIPQYVRDDLWRTFVFQPQLN